MRALALRFRGDEMPFLLSQIAGRQMAVRKIPSWYRNRELLYPSHLALEQASSEVTARYKASLVERGASFADLTGGLGVDFSFLAPLFRRALYVERDETLCGLAAHNFAALGLSHAAVHHSEAEKVLSQLQDVSLIYLDPARRDEGGRKVFRIEDCSPNLLQLSDIVVEKAECVMIKYSPMLDISLAVKTLPHVAAVHVLSVENECKELLFLLQHAKGTTEPHCHAVNLKKDGGCERLIFTPTEEEQEAPYCMAPGRYLYEPNASILKAGAFNVTAHRYGLQKLHKQSHLYTSEQLIGGFPGRTFLVDEWFRADRKQIRRYTSFTPKANVTVRNYPQSVTEIRKMSGLREGGDNYLFATTLVDGEKVWISCKKV